jgi:hypothetical protein
MESLDLGSKSGWPDPCVAARPMRSWSSFFGPLAAAFAVLSVGCGTSTGGDLDGVHLEVLSAAHDGSQYVIVGQRWDYEKVGPSHPILMTSPDARRFTVRDGDLPAVPLSSVAFGDGVFLTVGGELSQNAGESQLNESSTALFSTDGQTWTPSAGIPTESLRGVAFGNGTFVAVGAEGGTYHSMDGQTLTPGSRVDGISFPAGITFGAGRFVVYGEGASVFVSTDGASFSKVDLPIDGAKLDFAGGAFHGVGSVNAGGDSGGEGRLLASPDGLSWSVSPAKVFVSALAELNGTFLGVGGTDLFRSADAASWSSARSFDENTYRYDVIAAGGQFVVVGRNEITLSSDGQSFESISLR